MTQTVQTDWGGKKLLGMMFITGLSIAGISFFILDYEFTNSSHHVAELTMLCDDGFCNNPFTESVTEDFFVQYSTDLNSDEVVIQKTESFSSFTLNKNKVKSYDITDSSAVLFAAKDSFLREGIKHSNEGGSEILRVMGTGPINNRALIAFDQNDLEEIMVDKSLASAKLRLFIVSNDGQWADGKGLNLHSVVTNWDEGNAVNAPMGNIIDIENGVSWSCPSNTECDSWSGGKYNMEITDSITITNDIEAQWIEFDVTEDIGSFLVDAENNGWLIMKSDEESLGKVIFAAREASDNNPQLELIFS